MIPYLFVLFFTTVVVYAGRRHGSDGVAWMGIGIAISTMVLLAALRASHVGGDTPNYIRHYASVDSFQDIWRTSEIGFNALMVFGSSISESQVMLLFLISVIVVSLYVIASKLLVKKYEISIFLFIALGAYTFSFNGARQAIAAAICFFALKWLLERKAILYFGAVFIASLFHQSALIVIPLYFVALPKTGYWFLGAVGAGAVVVTGLLKVLVLLAADLLNDRYAYYVLEREGGGRVLASFLLCQGIVLFSLRNLVRENLRVPYARILNVYLVGFIPVIAAALSNVNPTGLMRLHFYFSHAAILLWPMVFVSWPASNFKNFVSLMFCTVVVLFFILTTFSFGNFYPYSFNVKVFGC